MGRRSRKRMADGAQPADGTSRAERDEARRRRAEAVGSGAATGRSRARGRPSIDERPPPPWGRFPLSELAVLVAIVMLAGLEVSIREHFAGFRSHSTLLAGSLAIVTITVIALAAGKVFVPILLAAGLGVFGIA